MKTYTTKRLEAAFYFAPNSRRMGSLNKGEQVMKTTEEMITVMQAHADGESIQFCHETEGPEHEWSTLDYEPRWNWHLYSYRVKPVEPKKVMMQMWRLTNQLYPHVKNEVSYPVGFDKDLSMQSEWSEKIGQPYEFVYPEEVK